MFPLETTVGLQSTGGKRIFKCQVVQQQLTLNEVFAVAGCKQLERRGNSCYGYDALVVSESTVDRVGVVLCTVCARFPIFF